MIEKIKDRKIDTILVDFDGTLMDTNDLIIKSWVHAIKEFTGKDADLDEVTKSFGETIQLTMPRLIPGIDVDTAIESYRNFQFDNYLENIHPFDGSIATLETLKEKGYKLALVTSRLSRSTYAALEHFDLGKYFEVVITADDCTEHKPNPAPLMMALEDLGKKPQNAMMIGDTKHDIGAAKAAEVVSVLVDYSVALPPGRRDGINPDYIIETFSDILVLLGETQE